VSSISPTSAPTDRNSAGSPFPLDPYPDKPRLIFRRDGTFKITIFSDHHFGENPHDGVGAVKDANSTRLMRAILHDEQPDYVCVPCDFSKPLQSLDVLIRVFNGDLITGDCMRFLCCAGLNQ
jgi:hypothetical protein